MTRKDYELIAQCISFAKDKHDVIVLLGVELARTNPRFDYDRFVRACEATK